MGFVVSNRGFNNTVSQYTVAYGRSSNRDQYNDVADGGTGLQTAMNGNAYDYVDTSFQDEE